MADVVVGIGGDISDLQRKTQAGERSITSFAGKVTSNVRAQFSSLGDSIAGAFAAGAVISQIKGTLDHFGNVQDMADRLGATAESIQKLDLMGAPSGAGAEDIVNSLTKVMRALDDTENATARGAFQRLGIDMQRMASASPDQQLLILADAFQRAQEKGEGFTEIYDLLGKSASNLIPVLRQSREDLERLAATPVLSDAQVARLDEIGDKLTGLAQKLTISVGGAMASFGASIEGIGESIGTQWAYIGNLFDNLKAGDSLGVASRKAAEFRDALTEAGKAVDEIKAPRAPIVKPEEGKAVDKIKAPRAPIVKPEEGISKAKELQENPPEGQEDSRSDYEIVIEMMVAERQLKQFYKDLKEMFIYQFQEPGLYDEFMGRLEKLRADRRQREVDHKLHLKALEMAARREKAKKVQFIQDMFAIGLGAIVSILIIIGIVWMFTLGG